MMIEVFANLIDFLKGRPRGRYGKCGNCTKCGVWRSSLHDDHIVPKAKNGIDDLSNRQLLCANCHQDKTQDDAKGKRTKPTAKYPASQGEKISAALTGRKRGPQSLLHRLAIGMGNRKAYSEGRRVPAGRAVSHG